MKSSYSTLKSRFILMSKGVAMGTADIIPGVSGGTIALISGIYDHFIQALDSVQLRHIFSVLTLLFLGWKKEKREEALEQLSTIEWQFLLPLFIGIILALSIMIQVIPYIMEHYGFYAFSFFFGLIIFSMTVPYKNMEHKWPEFSLLAFFAILTFFLVSMSKVSDSQINFKAQFQNQIATNNISKYQLHAKTNQKGQFEINIPVVSMMDFDHPDCINLSCIDLQKNTAFKVQAPNSKENFPGERVLIYKGSVLSTSQEKLGDFWVGIALADYSSHEYIDQQKMENGSNSSHTEPRVVILQSDLNKLGIKIKESKRIITGDVDVVYIKGSIGAEGNHNLFIIFLSGALAICAMVLPGISGAYILVLLGQYQYITGHVRDFVYNLKFVIAGQATATVQSLLMEQLIVIIVFTAGIVIGLFSFVRVLKVLLKSWHSLTMASLTGLMLGSLRYIWPPNHFEGGIMMWDHWMTFVMISVVGAVAVYGLEFTANKLSDPDAPDPDIK